MDFQTLKASVESALGRTDVPDYVYTLMTSDINRDIRILEMETLVTLSISTEATALPTDFLQVVSMYIDDATRTPMVPLTRQAQATRHDETGRPFYYAVTDGFLQSMPVPDATYSVKMRYLASVADFSNDADTNDVITLHPGLFLYSALHHAAIWKQDSEMAIGYGTSYANLITKVEESNKKKKNAGPLVQRMTVRL